MIRNNGLLLYHEQDIRIVFEEEKKIPEWYRQNLCLYI